MGLEYLFHTVSVTLQVFILNLLLSGDNAVVIALACRSQPPLLMRRAMSIGIGVAIALRILLTTVAGLLLQIPLLKLAGGVALTIIAVKLTIAKSSSAEAAEFGSENPQALWPIVGTIIAADLVMSVDNVVALAAVAQGNVFFLALGLLMCVPLLIYGSVFVTALLKRYPLLIRGGGAMLGWIGGDIAISDPMIAGWVNQQSPALTVVVPILVVVFVLFESRIMEGAQARAEALRPVAKRPRPAAPQAARAEIVAPAELAAPAEAREAVVAAPAATPSPTATGPAVAPHPGESSEESAAAAPAAAQESAAPDGDALPDKGTTLTLWIIVIIVLTLLLLLFSFLSLDFSSTTPAMQFTRPTGG
jgi:YjbE family integral membrane protein